jgi:chaperone modulatory protein CbpM
MTNPIIEVIQGTLLDERTLITLAELCLGCGVHAEYVIELVSEGALNPQGEYISEWRFSGNCLKRTRTAVRLQRDLGINVAGVALALDLLEEIETLQNR